MRIAILTNAYPPRTRGGCGRIAFIYAELFKARGHEVKVWGPRFWFYRLAKLPAPVRFFFHLRDLGSQSLTVKEIVDWQPDALLTHNLTGCGFATPRTIKKFLDFGPSGLTSSGRRMRWVHMLHDVQLFEPSGQIIHGESWPVARAAWRRFWAALRRRSLGEPDAVVSPTEWLMNEHAKRGFFRKTQKEVVPNPLGPAEVAVMKEREKPGRRDRRAIAFIGRLDPDKGIDVLLDAWQRVRHVASKLIIVGEGSRQDYLTRLADPKIIFKGRLENTQVLETLLGCGACVVPSLVLENQPTVILEALACGCRVVATDVGGASETLARAGWIVKPASAQSLAAGLLEALKPLENHTVESSRCEVLKRHEPEVCASRLEGLLKSNL